MRKWILVIAIIMLVLWLIGGYFFNLNAFLMTASSLSNFLYSLSYISIWLFLLIYGMKVKSKLTLRFYQIFWLIGTTYFLLYALFIHSPFAILLFINAPIFLFPMIGIDYLLAIIRSILRIDILYSVSAPIVFFGIVSLAMFCFSFIIKETND